MRVSISPKEFRAMLSPDMQKIFDSIVANMVELGQDEESSQALVAKTFFDYVKGKYTK